MGRTTSHKVFLRLSVACLALMGFCASGHAQTTATYYASAANPQTGNIVASTAVFTILGGGQLRIDITDTSVWSYNRGDVIGALLFNVANTVTVTTAEGAANITTALLNGAQVVTTNPAGVAANQTVDDTWVFGDMNTPTPDADNKYRYGVAGAGMSNPGVTPSAISDGKGVYGFAGFAQPDGNAGGGDNYLLMPQAAVPNGQNRYLNGGSINLIKGSIRITLSGMTNLTSTSQITGVGFLYASGANPTPQTYNEIPGILSMVPEPSALSFVAVGIVSGFIVRRRNASRTRNS